MPQENPENLGPAEEVEEKLSPEEEEEHRQRVWEMERQMETSLGMTQTAMSLWLSSATEEEKMRGPTSEELAETMLPLSRESSVKRQK